MSSELLKQAKRIGAWYWLATGKQEVSLDLLLLPLETAQKLLETKDEQIRLLLQAIEVGIKEREECLAKQQVNRDEQKKRLRDFLEHEEIWSESMREYISKWDKDEIKEIVAEVFGENASVSLDEGENKK